MWVIIDWRERVDIQKITRYSSRFPSTRFIISLLQIRLLIAACEYRLSLQPTIPDFSILGEIALFSSNWLFVSKLSEYNNYSLRQLKSQFLNLERATQNDLVIVEV